MWWFERWRSRSITCCSTSSKAIPFVAFDWVRRVCIYRQRKKNMHIWVFFFIPFGHDALRFIYSAIKLNPSITENWIQEWRKVEKKNAIAAANGRIFDLFSYKCLCFACLNWNESVTIEWVAFPKHKRYNYAVWVSSSWLFFFYPHLNTTGRKKQEQTHFHALLRLMCKHHFSKTERKCLPDWLVEQHMFGVLHHQSMARLDTQYYSSPFRLDFIERDIWSGARDKMWYGRSLSLSLPLCRQWRRQMTWIMANCFRFVNSLPKFLEKSKNKLKIRSILFIFRRWRAFVATFWCCI